MDRTSAESSLPEAYAGFSGSPAAAWLAAVYGLSPPLPLPSRAAVLRSLWLFVLTFLSVYSVGGLSMAVALMSILLAHEMGHYLTARHYRVDASLPYFIPFPLSLAGTFGAFIRLRGPIPHRRALFDIGVAGPLAGFLVCIPVLVLGVHEATWVSPSAGPSVGVPLLLSWAAEYVKGPAPEGMSFLIGPLGQAAWFGLFVTALNLMPVAQLDGGHITHAIFPRGAQWVSRAGLLLCVVLLFRRPTWLLWTLLLLAFGRQRHPPTLLERAPVGWPRVVVGLVAYAIFAVCFTPDPIVMSWGEFLALWRELLVWIGNRVWALT